MATINNSGGCTSWNNFFTLTIINPTQGKTYQYIGNEFSIKVC